MIDVFDVYRQDANNQQQRNLTQILISEIKEEQDELIQKLKNMNLKIDSLDCQMRVESKTVQQIKDIMDGFKINLSQGVPGLVELDIIYDTSGMNKKDVDSVVSSL